MILYVEKTEGTQLKDNISVEGVKKGEGRGSVHSSNTCEIAYFSWKCISSCNDLELNIDRHLL